MPKLDLTKVDELESDDGSSSSSSESDRDEDERKHLHLHPLQTKKKEVNLRDQKRFDVNDVPEEIRKMILNPWDLPKESDRDDEEKAGAGEDDADELPASASASKKSEEPKRDPPRARCPEGTELPYPWEEKVGKPHHNEKLMRRFLEEPKLYRQPDGSLSSKRREPNPWSVAARKDWQDLVHHCRTTGGLDASDGYGEDGVCYRYNVGCSWVQHKLYLEQLNIFPETNERGEYYGFDPKKIHPIDDDPTHFITKEVAASLRKLEARGIHGVKLEALYKEHSQSCGGWHWGEGEIPSERDDCVPEMTEEELEAEEALLARSREEDDLKSKPDTLFWQKYIEDMVQEDARFSV